MHFFQSVALAAHLTTFIYASPLPQSASSSAAYPQVTHQPGGDEHVVILSNDCPHPDTVLNRIGLNCEHSDVKYVFKNSAFQGFAANLHNTSTSALGGMNDVQNVEQSIQVTSMDATEAAATRPESPWGLQRVSSASTVSGNPTAIQYTYSYDSSSALGQGVDMYIVDTGLNSENVAFSGRVQTGWGYTNETSDGDGHGTHTAGTSAGFPFGLASNANIYPVKVLGSNGAGSSSDTVAGIDYVIQQHDARKTQGGFAGSVMSMSWGLSESSTAINTAIQGASAAGIHTAVAAGNSGADACGISPAQLGGSKNPNSAIVTVGSVGMSNTISYFSNNGACVDLYAPGEQIMSAWIGGANMVNSLSGTSMSTPHVSGLMAVMCSEDPTVQQNPALLKSRILSLALQGQISGNAGTGGQALLLNNGITDGTGVEGIL